MVVQFSSVDPLKIRELKAVAGKYAYSSRIKWSRGGKSLTFMTGVIMYIFGV